MLCKHTPKVIPCKHHHSCFTICLDCMSSFCSLSSLHQVHIQLSMPNISLYCCLLGRIMSIQFPVQSLHTLRTLVSPIIFPNDMIDRYELYGIDLEIDIKLFTEGIFDFGRIRGDTGSFPCGLYSFLIPGGLDKGIEGKFKKLFQTTCNFQGSFVRSMRHTQCISIGLSTPCCVVITLLKVFCGSYLICLISIIVSLCSFLKELSSGPWLHVVANF